MSHSAFKPFVLGKGIQKSRGISRPRRVLGSLFAATIAVYSQDLLADEGGVSVWLPGFFGSLAATPLQPGWSLTSIYYHTSVSAGADVTRAREITIGRIPINLNANLSANLNATGDLALFQRSAVSGNTSPKPVTASLMLSERAKGIAPNGVVNVPESVAARDVLVRPYNPRTPTVAWAPKTGVEKV